MKVRRSIIAGGAAVILGTTGALAVPGEASCWDSLGYAQHQLGNLTDAAACYSRALSIFRELGNRYGQADTLIHLGDTHHAAGEKGKAQDAWWQTLTILDELDHPDAAQLRIKLRQLGLALPAHEERR